MSWGFMMEIIMMKMLLEIEVISRDINFQSEINLVHVPDHPRLGLEAASPLVSGGE